MSDMLQGWVVVNMTEWDMHGPCPDFERASAYAKVKNGASGTGYIVKWGGRPRRDMRDSDLKLWGSGK